MNILTEEQRKKVGWDWMAEYKEELDDFLKTQVRETLKMVGEYLGDLIIGVEGCKFEERFDGDKGCIVLDMNMNQWNEYWGIPTEETQCLKCEEGISLKEHERNQGLCDECYRKFKFKVAALNQSEEE